MAYWQLETMKHLENNELIHVSDQVNLDHSSSHNMYMYSLEYWQSVHFLIDVHICYNNYTSIYISTTTFPPCI